VRGSEGLKQLFATYFAGFDFRETPGFLIAQGDMVVIHDTCWAKHTATFH
jgi:hypothetical protein